MPTNLYGPGDNFDMETSHVIPALIRKFREAKEQAMPTVTVWGTGKPMREFMYVDDMANACIFLLEKINASDIYDAGISHINIGTGTDVTIKALARMIAQVVGYRGRIVYDTSKPDGAPRKLLDVSRINDFGWRPKVTLSKGIEEAYEWYLNNQ